LEVDFFSSINLIVHYFLLDIPGYLDPNTGMAILTMLMGAVAAVGMTLKIYWTRLKLRLFHKNSK
jgi:hypothetical protein|tara:strand:+ start:215 stop:409 length:195 start_codon:yes stop_codon:yes gene_type:complete